MTPNVNLLPIRFRRIQAARQILTGWGLVGFVLLIAMFIHWYQESSHTSYMAEEIAMLEAKAEPINMVKQLSAKLETESVELREKWSLLATLLPDDDVLQTMGVVGTACRRTDDQVRVKVLELTIDAKSRLQSRDNAEQPSGTQTEESPKLSMQVHAKSDSVVAGLVDDLKGNPRLANVVLKSVGGSKNGVSRMVELHSEIVTSGGTR